MPEQYTKVRNLFDFPGVLNSKLIPSVLGGQNVSLFFVTYSDGTRTLNGNFNIAGGETVINGEGIITLTDPEIFGTFTDTGTVFNIGGAFAPGLIFGGAQYDAPSQTIIFRASTDIATLIPGVQYFINGTICPAELSELQLNFFGG